MTDLIFEQPLNEKNRSYLRLEYLYQQLQDNLEQDHNQRCFTPLFALCELNERCDYRTDILKDIDQQLVILKKWQNLPHVDHAQIDYYLRSLNSYRQQLYACERIGLSLKQDKFLSALRQRFNMPGACCNFDLPQLHYWLSQPWSVRQQQYQQWCIHFDKLLKPINMLLQLIRNTAEFKPAIAKSGFYQNEAQSPLSLIRVKLTAQQQVYPTISGHKTRCAIHFVDFSTNKHSNNDIEFMIAACR
ncbi:cell division protein ZapD [Shewanella marina]|uniref:cell division protein ZapD n=1 Tax=Shewanella marina TaxID=487319 RepID=UPI00047106D3|nr:cell division protein ZapD [Shewanella marina]